MIIHLSAADVRLAAANNNNPSEANENGKRNGPPDQTLLRREGTVQYYHAKVLRQISFNLLCKILGDFL